MENAYRILYIAALLFLGIAMFFALLRSIRGPRIADRIMGINMINSLAVLCIAICAFLLKESWLLDVCIIYGLISFLSVVVLSLIHIDAKKKKDQDEEAHHEQ